MLEQFRETRQDENFKTGQFKAENFYYKHNYGSNQSSQQSLDKQV